MAITTNTDPTVQTYSIFEAPSIKTFIIEQLNKNGIFIDQAYLGSNLNAFIDIISVLLQQIQFHYNTTATESTFATASLYENMNKLVSLINYKPTGFQTSILPIAINYNKTVENIEFTGTYYLPRYAFSQYNNTFVTREDLILNVTDRNATVHEGIMYQGTIQESEVYYATGEDFQLFTLVDQYVKETEGYFISDHFFDVYVKEPGNKWVQYSETPTLFNNSSSDKVFERRLNEFYNYEFKFGNNVNGYKPVAGSEIIIFYLRSNGEKAQLGNGLMMDEPIRLYSSEKYNEILFDTNIGLFGQSELPLYITPEQLQLFNAKNTGPSTVVAQAETAEIIRANAPKLFAIQNCLLSAEDYITYINKEFGHFVKDCTVFNNKTYTEKYLKYFYDIGIARPNDDPRVALNQVTFQSSCGFNNIYVILLPLINTIIEGKVPNYVNTNLKQYIVNQLDSMKDVVHNIAPIDPIYKAVSFGIERTDNNVLPSDFENVKLVLVRDKYSNFSTDYANAQAVNIFKEYFDNIKLGQTIDIAHLSSKLYQIPGITNVMMSDGNVTNDKLTLIVWNPLYEEDDFTVSQQNIRMETFMYPYFFDINNISNKITVINE